MTAAATDLKERTEYEVWLLEAVYDIVGDPFKHGPDAMVYPPDGGPPKFTIYGSFKIDLGDWRPGFLQVGAPLVFVTAFKVLDMLLEWVLGQNGHASTFRFVEKIKSLKGAKGHITFPHAIEQEPWMRERLIALYEELEPLRGTLIHERHFTSKGGGLEVAGSKKGTVGMMVSISAPDLRNLAVVLLSLLRHLLGTSPMDAYVVKRTRRALDELVHLHRLPVLGQLPVGRLRVRRYVAVTPTIDLDLDAIRSDIRANRTNQDVVWDLRLVMVAPDGAHSYLVPWEHLQGPRLRKTSAELAQWTAELPNDVDPAECARVLGLT
jgi:hypothetical protein